jgi:hypothetical protein
MTSDDTRARPPRTGRDDYAAPSRSAVVNAPWALLTERLLRHHSQRDRDGRPGLGGDEVLHILGDDIAGLASGRITGFRSR